MRNYFIKGFFVIALGSAMVSGACGSSSQMPTGSAGHGGGTAGTTGSAGTTGGAGTTGAAGAAGTTGSAGAGGSTGTGGMGGIAGAAALNTAIINASTVGGLTVTRTQPTIGYKSGACN